MRALTSARLRLRPFQEADLPALCRLHAKAEVVRFFFDGTIWSEEKNRKWLTLTLAWHHDHGLGHFAVVLKDQGTFIGRCGLSLAELEVGVPEPRCFLGHGNAPEGVPVTRELELGYTFDCAVWGQGYATEAARLMRDHAFGEKNVSSLFSMIHPENLASLGVTRKLSFTRQGRVWFSGQRLEKYGLDRAVWESLRAEKP